MATFQQNLQRFQTIANRGLQDQLDPDKRARFDAAVRRGLITMPSAEVDEQAQIQAQIQADAELAKQELAAQQGPLDAAAIGAGKAVMDAYRGIGRGVEAVTGLQLPGSELADAREQQAYEMLQEESPTATTIGEIGGQIGMMAIPGGAVGKIASTPARIAAGAGLGATEAGIIEAGQGGTPQEIALMSGLGGLIGGGAEALMPVLGKLAQDAIRKIGGKEAIKITDDAGNILPEFLDETGQLTPEADRMLESAGVDLSSLKQTAAEIVAPAPKTPEEAARLARFKEQGLPYTSGDISQTFADKSKEARLLEVVDDPLATEMRDIRKRQAQGIEGLKTQLVDKLATDDLAQTGENVKGAIKEAKKIARKDKNAAYDFLAEKAGYEGGIPIPVEKLQERIFNNNQFQSMADALTDGERETLNRLMVQYGVDPNPAAIQKYMPQETQIGDLKPLKTGMFDYPTQPTPITTKNAETLVKSLNAAAGPTSSPAMQGITRILKNEIDGSFELIDDVFKQDTDEIAKAATSARELNRIYRQDFSPESLVGKLIDTKRDGVTPVTEASNIYNSLFNLNRRRSTLEPIQKVVKQLQKTDAGQKSLGDLRANYVMDVIDKGFAQRSDMIEGQPLFQGRQSTYQMDRLGRQEAAALFEGAEDQLKKLQDIIQSGEEFTPSKKEVLKGSGSVVVDAVEKVAQLTAANKLPGVAGILNGGIQIGRKVAQQGEQSAALKKWLKNQPQLVQRGRFIQQNMPNLAARMGIANLDLEGDQE